MKLKEWFPYIKKWNVDSNQSLDYYCSGLDFNTLFYLGTYQNSDLVLLKTPDWIVCSWVIFISNKIIYQDVFIQQKSTWLILPVSHVLAQLQSMQVNQFQFPS